VHGSAVPDEAAGRCSSPNDRYWKERHIEVPSLGQL